MALTKGQKKQRDRETEEAKSVTDPARVQELLDSRFVDRFIHTLLSREETVKLVLPFWTGEKDRLKYQHGIDLVERVVKQMHIDTLTAQELTDVGVVEIMPNRLLEKEELTDDLLIVLANAWMDNTRVLRTYYEWRHKDASFKGASYKLEESANRQFRAITAPHLRRMQELADERKCAMPPVLRRPQLYYSSEMDEYRGWMKFIDYTPEE